MTRPPPKAALYCNQNTMPMHTADRTNRSETVVRALKGRPLLVRGVVQAASEAMNRDVVDLVVLGLHQQRVAIPTDEIDGVIAGVEDRRHLDNAPDEGWGDEFEAGTRMGVHRCSPSYRRERYRTLSHRGLRPMSVMAYDGSMPDDCLINTDHNGRLLLRRRGDDLPAIALERQKFA
jgi:hypothetical protein